MSDSGTRRTLRDLYAYNAWANAQVFDVCRGVDQAQLEAAAPGTVGSILNTLGHMVGVEAVYLLMLRDQMDALQRFRDEASGWTLEQWAARAARLGEEYRELLATADAGFYDQSLNVPWFDFALTKHDGLLQVLSHSAQHRAQVFSVLGEGGVQVPDLDFVLFVESKGQPGARPAGADSGPQ